MIAPRVGITLPTVAADAPMHVGHRRCPLVDEGQVGVDIGCGMMVAKASLHANHLPDNLHGVRKAIEKAVPHGRMDHGGRNDRGPWADAQTHHLEVWAKMKPIYRAIIDKYRKLNHGQRNPSPGHRQPFH